MERSSCWLAQHYADDSTDGRIGLLVGTKSQWWRSGWINKLVGWHNVALMLWLVCVQIVLLGTDDGLFALNPQSTSGRQHLVQLSGFGSVHQIAEAKGINMVLLLTGTAYALVTFLFSSFPSCLPSFLPAFLPSCLPSFLPSFLPVFILPSFLPSVLLSFLLFFPPSLHPPVLPSFLPAFPSFLPSFCAVFFPFLCHWLLCSLNLFCVPTSRLTSLLWDGKSCQLCLLLDRSCLQDGLDYTAHHLISKFCGEKGQMFNCVWNSESRSQNEECETQSLKGNLTEKASQALLMRME